MDAEYFDIFFPRWGLRPDYYLAVDLCHQHYAVNFEETGELDFERVTEAGVLRRVLTGPAVWLSHPGEHYRIRRRADARGCWRHWFVTFGGEEAEHWAERGLLELREPLKVTRPGRCAELFAQICRELDRGANDRAVPGLLELFLEIGEEARREPDREGAALRKLLEELRQTPERRWDWGEIARSLHWSEAHFRRRFRRAAGASPVEFLNHLRLHRAAALICDDPDLPLKHAAEQCGFDDVHYFGRLFRREFGQPPGAYRRIYGI